jgi:hypothetical protein
MPVERVPIARGTSIQFDHGQHEPILISVVIACRQENVVEVTLAVVENGFIVENAMLPFIRVWSRDQQTNVQGSVRVVRMGIGSVESLFGYDVGENLKIVIPVRGLATVVKDVEQLEEVPAWVWDVLIAHGVESHDAAVKNFSPGEREIAFLISRHEDRHEFIERIYRQGAYRFSG